MRGVLFFVASLGDTPPRVNAQKVKMLSLLKKIPGERAQVFVGTFFIFAIAASPLAYKELNKNSEQRKGHDLFSQEKPQAILDAEEERRKAYQRQQGGK